MFYRMNEISREPLLGLVFYLLTGCLVASLWWGLAELTSWEKNQAAIRLEEKPELAGALRAGSPEFNLYRGRIAIDRPQVTAVTADDRNIELIATVRNETGRVIKGLEVRGAVADAQGGVIEQTAVIIPTQQTAIEPNEAIKARLLLAGVRPEATPADVRVEVTGFIFD